MEGRSISKRIAPYFAPPLPAQVPDGTRVADDSAIREQAPELVLGFGDLPAEAFFKALGKTSTELAQASVGTRATVVSQALKNPASVAVLGAQIGHVKGQQGAPISSLDPVEERVFRMQYFGTVSGSTPETSRRTYGRRDLDARVRDVGTFVHRGKNLIEALGDHQLSEVLTHAFKLTKGQVGTVTQIGSMPVKERRALTEAIIDSVAKGPPAQTSAQLAMQQLSASSETQSAPDANAGSNAAIQGGLWNQTKRWFRRLGTAAVGAMALGAMLLAPNPTGDATVKVEKTPPPVVFTESPAPPTMEPDTLEAQRSPIPPSVLEQLDRPMDAPVLTAPVHVDPLPQIDRTPPVRTHEVIKHDAMWDIAKAQGMSFATLWSMNPDQTNPDLIFPGDQLVIQGPLSTPKYRAKEDETAGEIVQRFGITLDDLEKANPGYQREQTIYPKDVFFIPMLPEQR